MKIDFENAKIYARPGSTDLRKGATGLAQIIENEMKLNALSESVFLFCNKNHKLLKVISWNKTGFWIAQKRLERATETAARKNFLLKLKIRVPKMP